MEGDHDAVLKSGVCTFIVRNVIESDVIDNHYVREGRSGDLVHRVYLSVEWLP